MIQETVILWMGILAAFFQFVAAYIGFRIYNFERLSRWWFALIFAFLIQGVRRVFTVFDDLGQPLLGSSIMFDRILMFVISLLILIGLWAMCKEFESFEVVEKKIREKFGKPKK